MLTFSPTNTLISVLFPAFALPITATYPLLIKLSFFFLGASAPRNCFGKLSVRRVPAYAFLFATRNAKLFKHRFFPVAHTGFFVVRFVIKPQTVHCPVHD